MTPAYFLDTNIVLYALSMAHDHRAKQPVALDWLRRADWGVSTQVLMEFYNNASHARHGLPAGVARTLVQRIMAQRPVQGVDAALVADALALSERCQISHWDAAIVCAAGRLGAHTVVSEDLNHGQDYGGVRVLNPFVAAG